jgi:hypothetical protein
MGVWWGPYRFRRIRRLAVLKTARKKKTKFVALFAASTVTMMTILSQWTVNVPENVNIPLRMHSDCERLGKNSVKGFQSCQCRVLFVCLGKKRKCSMLVKGREIERNWLLFVPSTVMNRKGPRVLH